MVACRAGAIGALAHGARVRAVGALTGVALVVVAVVLAVGVTAVDVVHVIAMDDGPVAAVRAVGVGVGLSGTVLNSGGHDSSDRGRSPAAPECHAKSKNKEIWHANTKMFLSNI